MNEDRFCGMAAVYDQYRPGYPDALADYLFDKVDLSAESRAADIGAGTGIWSEMLLRRGCAVVCVEPNDDMRALADEKLTQYSGFISVGAPAEHTTLEDASVDLITVAQAFHWSAETAFRAEAARILRPGGKAALIWNSRKTPDAFTDENRALCETHCPDFKGFSGGQTQNKRAFASFFKDGECTLKVFDNPQRYDLAAFIGRHLSASYVPKESDIAYTPFVRDLTALFEKYSRGGIITMPCDTRCFLGGV